MNTTLVTFPLEISKRDELDQLAESIGRDRGSIINEALDQYLDSQRRQIEHVRLSIKYTEAGGQTLSTKEVLERIASGSAARSAGKASGRCRYPL